MAMLNNQRVCLTVFGHERWDWSGFMVTKKGNYMAFNHEKKTFVVNPMACTVPGTNNLGVSLDFYVIRLAGEWSNGPGGRPVPGWYRPTDDMFYPFVGCYPRLGHVSAMGVGPWLVDMGVGWNIPHFEPGDLQPWISSKTTKRMPKSDQIYLVGGLEHVLFLHILRIIIPTDELVFSEG